MKRVLLSSILLLAAVAPLHATDVTIGGNTYTLADHPRLFLDGPAGTITARVKDPDGGGAGVAPQATDSNPAFVALKAEIRSCVASPNFCSAESQRSAFVLMMALDWYMDNSQTASRDAAIHWINNIETWVSDTFELGCDIKELYCGINAWPLWSDYNIIYVAQAYSLVRSEMNAGERTAFYQKMFNDDAVYYEDTCDNQLQRLPTAVASFTSGATTVTGSGFAGLTAGRKIHLRPTDPFSSGYWATIQTVNSDNLITLTGTPQYPLGGNAPTQTNGYIYELQPWTSTTCGLFWRNFHQSYAPRDTIGAIALTNSSPYGTGDATIPVTSVAGLPSPPFYIASTGTGETMKVTAINGTILSVDRAQLYTTAGNRFSDTLYYTRYIPNTGASDYTHNHVLHHLSAAIVTAIALADEGALARDWLTRAANTWLTYTYPRNRDMWTGFQQGGSSSYGFSIELSRNYYVVAALKNIPGSPSLDKSGGNWLQNQTAMFLYSTRPDSLTKIIPYGQADVSADVDYFDHQWAVVQTYLLGATSDQAKWWNYWQRTITNQWTSAQLGGDAHQRLIVMGLMYWQESDATADYRSALPTQKAFTTVDGTQAYALGFWISRTGWTATTDSVVYADAYSLQWTIDHIGPGAPGAYRLYKNGFQLTETDSPNHVGSGAGTNMVLFGGAANLGAVGSHLVSLDRNNSGTGWAYARIDSRAAYTTATAVTRSMRSLIHFKKAASPDYLVVHDNAATSVAKTIGINLHFDKTSGQSSTMTDSSVPSLVWTGSNRRLSTAVVLPTGVGVAGTYSGLTNSHRVNVCASSDGATCASTTSAEFLMVHKPSTDTGDTIPTVAALGTIDANYSGVEIKDASAPSVAVFPKSADQDATSFTTTHTGTAQYVVAGLAAGTYDVVRGGVTTVVDDGVIGASGTIAFESVSGAFTVTQVGTPPAIEITTTTLANCVQNQPCSSTLAYSGGTPPVEWTVTAGTLCAGQSLNSTTGEISGNPTTIQTCNFTVQVEDNALQTDTQALSRTIVTPPPSMVVQAMPGSNGVIVKFSTAGLDNLQQCDVVVSDSEINDQTGFPIGPVGSASSTSGRSSRVVAVGELTPEHDHTVNVTCGAVASGQASFTTTAAVGGTVTWHYDVEPAAWLQALSAAKVTVEAVPTVGSTVSSTNAACTNGCRVDLSLASGGVYTIRHIWKTAGDAVLATTQYSPIVIP